MLNAFRRAGNRITVEDIYDWWGLTGYSDIDVDRWGSPNVRIQLDESLNAVEKAEHLYERLVESLGADSYGMRKALMEELLNPNYDEEDFDLVLESYQAGLRTGAGLAAALSEAYITGAVEVLPGGAILLAGHYTAEGEYTNAGLVAFPLIGIGRKVRVRRVKDGPDFPNLKDHARRHSDLRPNAYYNHAVENVRTGQAFKVRHGGQMKVAHVTRLGPDTFLFTSRSLNGKTIFTHLEVTLQYLKNKGITLPNGF